MALIEKNNEDIEMIAMVSDEESSSLLRPRMPATITRSRDLKTLPEDAPEIEHEDEDAVSAAVGDYGPWQLRLTFLLALFNLPCTWHIMAITFQTRPTPYWCARSDDIRDSGVTPAIWRNVSHVKNDSSCEIWDRNYTSQLKYIVDNMEHFTFDDINNAMGDQGDNFSSRPCTSWEFDTSDGDTIISQWQLVCSREQLSNVAEMMFLAGVALGGLISGIISDRFGRRKTLLISLTIQIAAGTGIAFAPWFELYMVLRIILGFVSVSVVFSAFVLCMEIVGGKWRTISGVSFLFPVPLGYITIAGIAYMVRGWRYLQLAVTLPAMLLFGLFWVLPESPRWLLAMGRREELLKVLQRGARANNRVLPDNPDKMLAKFGGSEKNGTEETSRPGFFDLFRTSHIRKISLILYIIWFTLYLVYYGLMLNLGNMAGDIYLNTVIAGLVEVPAIALSILILMKGGRRLTLCITVTGAGIACLLTLTVPEGMQWLTLVFTMLGKFAISCSNAILPVFTAELFPTVVRNLGVGSSNMAAGVALMLVPYLWNLSNIAIQLPMAVLGTLGLIGGACSLLLPETAGRSLPETLAELERRGDEKDEAEEREKHKKEASNESVKDSYRRTMSPERY